MEIDLYTGLSLLVIAAIGILSVIMGLGFFVGRIRHPQNKGYDATSGIAWVGIGGFMYAIFFSAVLQIL